MNARMLHSGGDHRMFVLVFDSGDEVSETLLEWARTHGVAAASFTGIGAFARATVGYFDVDRREYLRIPIDEQVEVLSLTGNIARAGHGPRLHAHVVLGRRDGSACGGHLLDARVRPTLELVLLESPPHLQRRHDPATGLALLDLSR